MSDKLEQRQTELHDASVRLEQEARMAQQVLWDCYYVTHPKTKMLPSEREIINRVHNRVKKYLLDREGD